MVLVAQMEGLAEGKHVIPGDYVICDAQARVLYSQEPLGQREQSFEVRLSLDPRDQPPAVLRVR